MLKTMTLTTLATLILVGAALAQEIPADKGEVTKTESGLSYCILKSATGKKPTLDDFVVCHYTGWLEDGKVFDSSRNRGTPARFPIRNLIKGWQEGLQLMPVGSRYKFTIPHELAYGERGQGPIPAKATLIFDLELIDIIEVPKFVKMEEDKTKTADKGLKYQTLQEGSGDLITDHRCLKVQGPVRAQVIPAFRHRDGHGVGGIQGQERFRTLRVFGPVVERNMRPD